MTVLGGGVGVGSNRSAERLRAVASSERVHDGAELQRDVSDRAQVCVIGTGAGGASAAFELVRRGHSVILIEEGGYHLGGDLGFEAEPEAAVAREPAALGRAHGTAIGLKVGRCVGGTTVLGAGTCERPPDEALDAWPVQHDLAGLDAAALQPYFDRIEQELGVASVPDATFGRNGELLELGAKSAGHAGERVKRAALGCLGSGVCHLGCPQDAKQAMHVSFVPDALDAGASLYTRARATELLISQGRAFGVTCALVDAAGNPTGRRLRVVAERVVVACGSLLTPMLLARSGLAGGRPHLGRHLRLHPTARVTARFPGEVRGWAGVPEAYAVRALEPEGISIRSHFPRPEDLAPAIPGVGELHKEAMSRIARLASFTATIRDEPSGRVRASRRRASTIRYRLREADRRRLLRAIGVAAEIAFAAGAEEVYPGIRSLPRLSTPDEARSLAGARTPARDLALEGWNPIGTARMADDPKKGVTDATGQLHGLRDLYVADASLLPASIGPSPQLTVMALGRRIGELLSSGLGAPL